MGDFSIRCAISGVPIPCGTPVLVLKVAKSEKHPEYQYPVGMPCAGEMGSYGKLDDYTYEEGFTYLHVLPNLWVSAGTIWTAAMFDGKKPKSLYDEIEKERAEYRKTLREYEQFRGQESYDELIRSLMKIRLNDRGEWMRRLKNVVLFAPDFGETNYLVNTTVGMITQEVTPDRPAVNSIQELVAAFMSSCITGVNLGGGGETYPFEQYPTLKWDLQWHQAIVKEIKRLRKDGL